MRDTTGAPVAWAMRAESVLRNKGTITAILRADRLESWCAAVGGAVLAKPLLPREGDAAKRVIVRLVPGPRTSLTLLPALSLHEDDGRPTHAADAILRHGAALAMI